MPILIFLGDLLVDLPSDDPVPRPGNAPADVTTTTTTTTPLEEPKKKSKRTHRKSSSSQQQQQPVTAEPPSGGQEGPDIDFWLLSGGSRTRVVGNVAEPAAEKRTKKKTKKKVGIQAVLSIGSKLRTFWGKLWWNGTA